jgi:flagellar basal-body rod modification protein FlgD
MKNQDPTAATDPNQYVNQLVSVNSLEQLIEINQTLSAATSQTPASSSASAPGLRPSALADNVLQPAPASATQGNIAIPATNPAAQTVAAALGGRAHLN